MSRHEIAEALDRVLGPVTKPCAQARRNWHADMLHTYLLMNGDYHPGRVMARRLGVTTRTIERYRKVLRLIRKEIAT